MTLPLCMYRKWSIFRPKNSQSCQNNYQNTEFQKSIFCLYDQNCYKMIKTLTFWFRFILFYPKTADTHLSVHFKQYSCIQ
jgi:hypothetical protein